MAPMTLRLMQSRRGGAVGDAVTLLLRLLGTLLLLLAGMGGGFAAAARAENSRRQLHSFARLLTYLAELLDAQALTGPELLRRAAQEQKMMKQYQLAMPQQVFSGETGMQALESLAARHKKGSRLYGCRHPGIRCSGTPAGRTGQSGSTLCGV